MRPLNRSTMPLVRGDPGGVRRCPVPSAPQGRSNSCSPVAARLHRPNIRSVNSLPLSVRMVPIRIGQARSVSRGNRRALAAVLVVKRRMRTPRVALSRATKREWRQLSSAIRGRYLTSMWREPCPWVLKPLCPGFGAPALRSRRFPTPCRRRQRSSPERQAFGLGNSRTTAGRSSGQTGNVWRSATATASCNGFLRQLPATASASSEAGAACGCHPRRCPGCATCRRSAL